MWLVFLACGEKIKKKYYIWRLVKFDGCLGCLAAFALMAKSEILK